MGFPKKKILFIFSLDKLRGVCYNGNFAPHTRGRDAKFGHVQHF